MAARRIQFQAEIRRGTAIYKGHAAGDIDTADRPLSAHRQGNRPIKMRIGLPGEAAETRPHACHRRAQSQSVKAVGKLRLPALEIASAVQRRAGRRAHAHIIAHCYRHQRILEKGQPHRDGMKILLPRRRQPEPVAQVSRIDIQKLGDIESAAAIGGGEIAARVRRAQQKPRLLLLHADTQRPHAPAIGRHHVGAVAHIGGLDRAQAVARLGFGKSRARQRQYKHKSQADLPHHVSR